MSMTELAEIMIDTTNGHSRIVVGPGRLAEVGRLIAERWPQARAAWVVSDSSVAPLHGPAVAAQLAAAGLRAEHYAVPAGEASKSMTQALALYDWLLGGEVKRSDVIVALGGGMVGDLAGFVAATCLRGLPLVQIPTTLLAMVDSSIGGKTGINHATGKNLIGAFYQPPLVVVDPTLLSTLPPRELAAGWGEVIKYAFIERSIPGFETGEPILLPWLERAAAALQRLEPAATAAVIHHCIDLKARVVRVDPTEQGLRAILNYGHTAGHAIEAEAGYGRLLHGEAVAIGMRAAMLLAVSTGHCAPALLDRQQTLIRRFSLPERAAGATVAALWPYLRRDKKATAGSLRWVLPTEPGRVELVRGIADGHVDAALEQVIA